jgi:hypothetical protein
MDGGPNYDGPCPAEPRFTGSINGPPGTTVEYTFIFQYEGYIYPEDGPYRAWSSDTIPASGYLSVSKEITVGPEVGPGWEHQWVKVVVRSPVTAQSPAHHDLADSAVVFTVACHTVRAGEEHPVPSRHIVGTSRLGIIDNRLEGVTFSAPTDLHETADKYECLWHLLGNNTRGDFDRSNEDESPGLGISWTTVGQAENAAYPMCRDVLQAGGVVVVFSWGTDVFAQPDGFRVYALPDHKLIPDAVPQLPKSVPYNDLFPPAHVWFKRPTLGPTCYVIRAYWEWHESPDSAQICIGRRLPLERQP